jgi:hypothetical protein
VYGRCSRKTRISCSCFGDPNPTSKISGRTFVSSARTSSTSLDEGGLSIKGLEAHYSRRAAPRRSSADAGNCSDERAGRAHGGGDHLCEAGLCRTRHEPRFGWSSPDTYTAYAQEILCVTRTCGFCPCAGSNVDSPCSLRGQDASDGSRRRQRRRTETRSRCRPCALPESSSTTGPRI